MRKFILGAVVGWFITSVTLVHYLESEGVELP